VFESPLFPNLLYLVLMAGIWLAALAVVSPGTGILELLALTALGAAGLGTLYAPLNAWALLLLLVGIVFFLLSLRFIKPEIGLIISALAFSLGSVFMFQPTQGLVAVHPALALVVSLLTIGYFWLAVRKVLLAQRAQPTIDLARLIGATGDVRTPLDPQGSVYVLGELWTAESDVPVQPGQHVKVIARDGLILMVEPVEDTKSH
jgi:membrane-bound serine protease (ClpP class)